MRAGAAARSAGSPEALRDGRLGLEELALLALGLCEGLACAPRAVAWTLLGGAALHLLAILCARGRAWESAARLAGCYISALAIYSSAGEVVLALSFAPWDEALLAADRRLFGETPSAGALAVSNPWLVELLSLCYLSYHGWLHGALLAEGWRGGAAATRLRRWVFGAFALGLPGYLWVPARGPEAAFPELFEAPLVGGWGAAMNAWVVGAGSSVFDVFPSLHLLVTGALLWHDARHRRRRAWAMAAPGLGLVVSTMALRYHYGVDLLAGLALLLVLRLAMGAGTETGGRDGDRSGDRRGVHLRG